MLVIGALTLSSSAVFASHGLEGAREFDSFRVYFSGKRVLGLKLDNIQVLGDSRKAEVVAFYGNCESQGGGGCSYPLEVRTTSICRTYPDIYFSPPKLRRINGTWGGWVRTARIFDVYSGRSTVSIYGAAENRARKVAKELKDVRRNRRGTHLPGVRAELLNGKGRCQHGPGVAPLDH